MDMYLGLKEGLIFAKLGLIFCECDDNSLRRVTVCLAYVEVARQTSLFPAISLWMSFYNFRVLLDSVTTFDFETFDLNAL